MTVIVTGGAGFIGGNFIYYMLKNHPEDRVVCMDCLTYAGNLSTLKEAMEHSNFRFCKINICDREAVYGLFEEEHPDVVINFAAESHVTAEADYMLLIIDNPDAIEQISNSKEALASYKNIIGCLLYTSMQALKMYGKYLSLTTEN